MSITGGKVGAIAESLRIFGDLTKPPVLRSNAFWLSQELIYKGTDQLLHRNPWADQAVLEMCRERFIGFSGCASSGKTTIAGRFGLLFWLSKPKHTKIMVTSTDTRGARNRIWGQVKEGFLAAQHNVGFPGKLVDSLGSIVLDLEEGAYSSRSGIELFAGDQKKSAECIQRWIGIKNQRVMLILDEMPYLGPQLLTAAYTNLIANPYFQLIGLGNFQSKLDPFGTYCEPKAGWDSVSVDDEEWETNYNGIKGKCIRFDGSRSPNVLAGENVYSEIYSVELFNKHKAIGETSPGFWQMCRSFPAPTGIGNQIYTEAHFDFTKQSEPIWMTVPITVAFLDPAFTNGGDRSQVVIGKYGTAVSGNPHLHLTHYQELHEDVTKQNIDRNYQIAQQFRDLCRHHGVRPENAALDSTGAGIPFLSIVGNEWSRAVVGVDFGGSASERPAADSDGRAGNVVYYNRVAEIWVQGRDYFSTGCITGCTRNLATELCMREFDNLGQQKIKVESKKLMKKRMGRSPDLADAALGLLELCRIRFSFPPTRAGSQSKIETSRAIGDGGYYQGLASLSDKVNVAPNGWQTTEQPESLPWRTIHAVYDSDRGGSESWDAWRTHP